ncbi:hypothetical protein Z951_39695 [Streptomyces sp. PRh5]|nr:hypothetical protein Z951_39695 [Streptomyces sp. PRh5]
MAGGVDVDEIAHGSAVGQSPELGADDIVESEDGGVGGSCGLAPEGFFEDVDLALLAAGKVRDDEAAGERIAPISRTCQPRSVSLAVRVRGPDARVSGL